MRIVNADVELIKARNKTPYEMVELAGRTCYKSNDKIAEGTAKKFVENMVNRKHFAMLEHGIVHFWADSTFTTISFAEELKQLAEDFGNYLNVAVIGYKVVLAASLRTWYDIVGMKINELECECGIIAQLKDKYPEVFGAGNMAKYYENESYNSFRLVNYEDIREYWNAMSDGDKEATCGQMMKISYHTMVFTCDRGITHEIVRHRPCSFAQESTRYCNYSGDKFGKEITFIRPLFFEKGTVAWKLWYRAMESAEQHYMELLDTVKNPDVDPEVKVIAQEARSVLPNSVKADIVVTANEVEWQHILNIRYHGVTGAPHPQMVEVMKIAYPKIVMDSDWRLK